MLKSFTTCIFILGVLLAMLAFPAAALADSSGSGIYYNTLEQNLKTYLNNQRGVYGVYVIDLKTGSTFGINENEVFHAASTFKLPTALYVLKLVKKGEISLNDRLEYKEKHYETGTGILQKEPYGSFFTIKRLLKESIVCSDNVAVNMLLDRVGKSNVKDFMRDLGGKVVDNFNNTTCPIDMANYMFDVLLFSSEEPVLGGILMDYLYNTVFNDRIPALLPEGVLVAHKIGTWPLTGTYNDVGFVEHPTRPYIISVFSKKVPSAAEAVSVISYISRAVFDYQGRPDFSVELFFNGRQLPLKNSAVLRYHDKSIVVPLREFTKCIPGLGVYWDGISRKIVVTSVFTRKQLSYPVDGGCVQIVNGKSYIPIHILAGDLNYTITWDNKNYRVFLNDSLFIPNSLVSFFKGW